MSWSNVTTRLLKFVATATVSGLLVGALAFVGAYAYFAPRLPSVASLRDPQLSVPLRIYTADQKLIGEFGPNRRSPVSYQNIPPQLVHAFLAAEDANFFHHPGVSIKGLLRAAVNLALTGRKTQGGSTITMQVARNYFLSDRKTFTRKFKEILLALRIDRRYSKQKILELYLNKIYFGEGAYGISAAAHTYYGEDLSQLTLPQMAMLAGLPQAPSAANPLSDQQAALDRRNYVLGRMRDLGYISPERYRQAISDSLTASLHQEQIPVSAQYVADLVRSRMLQRFGPKAYTDGYRVVTTLDAADQQDAVRALRADLLAYARRHGYRGPEGRISLPAPHQALPIPLLKETLGKHPGIGGLRAGVVVGVQARSATVYTLHDGTVTVAWKGMSWARPYKGPDALGAAPEKAADVVARGDIVRIAPDPASGGWSLAQVPHVQGALVALDPRTGAVRSLVGGFDFTQSKYDRALMARRQPGSSFKPYIYSAALHQGMTQATVINNAPVVVPAGYDATWRPQNYERTFSGPTPLRQGLFHSLNLVSIRVLQRVGIANARRYATRFGFPEKQLPDNLTLALGSAAVTPMQMARGYAVFANGGFLVNPHFIRRIIGPDGHTIFQARPAVACPSGGDAGAGQDRCAQRVINAQNAYIMTEMMHGVIRYGTGRAARQLGRDDLSGKTGTTNRQKDAWFGGFNRRLVTVCWVGFDQPSTLGRRETGARAALPMWIRFMGAALRGVPESPPLEPPGLVTARVDPHTGKRVRNAAKDTVFETFRADHLPPFENANAYAGSGSGGSGSGGSNLERALY